MLPEPPEMSVDLSLAINYVPAAFCLVRVLLYMIAICAIGPGEEIGGFLIAGLVLYVDRAVVRVYTQHTIFDATAVVSAVYFSNVYMLVRTSVTDTRVSFMHVVAHMLWMLCCGCLLVEPARLTKVFERRNRAYHAVPAVITAVALVALSLHHADREPAGIRVTRAMTFSVLAIGWVYIVATQKFTGAQEHSTHFVARFAPVLVCPVYMAGLFALAAAGCLGYQYYELFIAPNAPPAKPPERLDMAQPKTSPTLVVEPDIEEAFRAARLAKQSSHRDSGGGSAA